VAGRGGAGAGPGEGAGPRAGEGGAATPVARSTPAATLFAAASTPRRFPGGTPAHARERAAGAAATRAEAAGEAAAGAAARAGAAAALLAATAADVETAAARRAWLARHLRGAAALAAALADAPHCGEHGRAAAPPPGAGAAEAESGVSEALAALVDGAPARALAGGGAEGQGYYAPGTEFSRLVAARGGEREAAIALVAGRAADAAAFSLSSDWPRRVYASGQRAGEGEGEQGGDGGEGPGGRGRGRGRAGTHRAFVRVDEVGVRVAMSVWEADE